jgi:hypothetical protein
MGACVGLEIVGISAGHPKGLFSSLNSSIAIKQTLIS